MSQMKLIQRRDIIRGVRDRWLAQYKNSRADHTFGGSNNKSVASVREALSNLDLETCSAADVHAATGVTGWVRNECDECHCDFPLVVQLGEEPDYESRWWNLCGNCLDKARDLLASTEAEK